MKKDCEMARLDPIGICSNSSSPLNMDSNNAALNEVYLRIPVSAKQKNLNCSGF